MRLPLAGPFARRFGRGCLYAAAWTLVVCADPLMGEDESTDTFTVHYELDWDWGDATATADGWTVLTDRGYQVVVTEGFLMTDSVQLVVCSDTDLGSVASLLRFVGAVRAWAGHGRQQDPSAWRVGYAESLSRPSRVALGGVKVGSGVYCRAHFLVAGAETDTVGLPAAPDLVGTSVYVVGEATGADGEALPFTIWSTLPVGSLVGWSDPVAPIDTASGDVRVTIIRDLGHLFDGIDFATMGPESIEKSLLLGLANRVRVSVESGL